MSTNACAACPWLKKGQPDITDELREHAKRGAWFCCHVNMGTCQGAALYSQPLDAKPAAEKAKS